MPIQTGHADAAVPTVAAPKRLQNGPFPPLPANALSGTGEAQQPGMSLLERHEWAPCGTDTPEQLKASFSSQLNTLLADIQSARGKPSYLEDAYARFANTSQALLAFFTTSRIDDEVVSRIASVVLRRLDAAPQQPPYRATPGLSTLEAAKQAAAHYATR